MPGFHFLASDAHNLTSRTPNLGDGHAALVKEYGQETADRLCIYNPRGLLRRTPPTNPNPSTQTKNPKQKTRA